MQSTGTSSRALGWLHPRFVLLYLAVPLLVTAYLIPESAYLILYRSEKNVDLDFVILGLLVYAGFTAGTFFLVSMGRRSQEGEAIRYCRWVVWPLFIMTVFGYLAWFASAAIKAGSPGALLSALFSVVLQPEFAASAYVRGYLFQPVTGITTFTQFGILYATVEALLWVYGATSRKPALIRFFTVLAFGLVRATLISERLGLVEFLVPVGVVLLAHARWTRIGRPLVRLAPLLAGFVIFALFAIGEYFRSWNYYQALYDGPYLRFAAERFFGYYATAVNNASVSYYYDGGLQPFQHSLRFLFEAPVLGGALSEFYNGSLFPYRGLEHQQMLSTYANPEFNNVAMVGLLLSDFSSYLAPVAAFLLGVLSFSLYKSFARGRLVGLLLYPSWFIGLLEISRIYYWPAGRYLPVLAFLVGSLILFKHARIPAASTLAGARKGRGPRVAPVRPAGRAGKRSDARLRT